ncbi:serine/threonine-protein phosphatase [Burkholderiaceae bacterium FT117]|uniref:PP2C family protein-serine/threonine phosphatase n=1 Tax=Zeimonas sediminis TaxID=2944268 RepID=UPI002342F81C|nr:PP2C family serine/threonine-protein phosphatase [Zeimonas sediminis]MCM5571995.1 serine/threonine-protein phosphatase [Zeimonas sediminis]
MRFSIYQDSLIGERQVNQDRMGYCFTRDSLLMLVADGMGGHLHGEIAAQMALQAAAAAFQSQARPMLADPAAFLDLALRRGHREILRFQHANRLPDAPRTTIVACVVQQGQAWWAHAGDSRFYWLRGGAVMARTRDHSKVQNLVDLGLVHPDDAERHPERNKVLNCLGSPFEPTIEIGGPLPLAAGDTLLLCSDGVWAPLAEADLLAALGEDSVLVGVPLLVRRAVELGGVLADNATALAMTWEGEEETGEGVSSALVPDGAITTTISVGPPDEAAPDAISEDEIERTIREIRDAIARTGGSS